MKICVPLYSGRTIHHSHCIQLLLINGAPCQGKQSPAKQKTVSLDFEEESVRGGHQGNYKISKLIIFN